MDWLKTNWVILAALATAASAWGTQQAKINSLEDVVTQQAPVNTKLQEQTARVDERTQAMQNDINEQHKLLLMILDAQTKKH